MTIFKFFSETYYFFQTATDVHVTIENRRIYSLQKNVTLQPFMLVAGSKDTGYSFYCVVNDILYPTESAVKTLDVTFKVIFALDLKYQVECRHVWTCIQKLLYNIDTGNDRFSISTDSVISKIKSEWNKL